MFRLRLVAAPAVAIFLCANLQASEPLISIQDCVQGDVPSLRCKEKLQIDLQLSYSFDAGPISFTVSEADGRALDRPAEISISQAEPKVTYPLTYLHTVPFHPTEEVIVVRNSFPGVQKCVDAPDAENPTCGWAYADGRRIEHSQGFCCNKDWELITEPGWWRGEEESGQRSKVIGSFSTAHCYRPGEIMFSGYRVSPPIIRDEIFVRVTIGDLSKEFALTRANPYYRSIEGTQMFVIGTTPPLNIFGRAEHELGSGQIPPDFGDSVLYVPAAPSDHPFVEEIALHTMLVNADEVDATGRVCDKVGIGYMGFRYQGGGGTMPIAGTEVVGQYETSGGREKKQLEMDSVNPTEVIDSPPFQTGSPCAVTKVGDCLHNQLFHKYQKDLETIHNNRQANTRYLIKGMPAFTRALFSIDETKLEYVTEWMHSPRLIIEIDASDIFPEDVKPIQVGPPVGPIKKKD
jgi:hypothetical protein